jgi:hypothetical protein
VVLHGKYISGRPEKKKAEADPLDRDYLIKSFSLNLIVELLSGCSPKHALTAPVTAAKLARVSPINLMPRKFWIRPYILNLMRSWSHRMVKIDLRS